MIKAYFAIIAPFDQSDQ